jgi:hypothetical protein
MSQFTKGLTAALLFIGMSFAQKYTPDGKLQLPADYREWIYLSAGIGMDYSKEPSAHPQIDNVFVNPEAYRAFLKTGSWPDKTVFVKENRMSGDDPLSKGGKFQQDVESRELHVKDASHGGWVFYVFGKDQTAKPFDKQQICVDCHTKNGATETTFVQYYPTLIDAAKQHGTYHPPK